MLEQICLGLRIRNNGGLLCLIYIQKRPETSYLTVRI
jgi:hypothetical protein